MDEQLPQVILDFEPPAAPEVMFSLPTEDEDLTQARLWLCTGAKLAIANVLGLLGVSAPEAMERVDA